VKADAIVIGAGASGLMCAMEAGKRGRRVLVLEHTERIGSKICLSGGGRCNFTNRHVGREHYLSQNPHFATSALSRFTPQEFIAMLERHGIGFEEREAGQLFCTGSSKEIIDMLKVECDKVGVDFLLSCTISEIGRNAGFQISTNRGIFASEALVIATGGLSMPNIGATHFGYSIAKQFGLKVTPLKPALTPLIFSREDRAVFGALAGISLDAVASCRGEKFRGKVLFTHKGLSGPATLQISSHWDRNAGIAIDLLPDTDIHAILVEQHQRKMLLTTLLDQYLPGRFVKLWCDLHIPSRPLNQYSLKKLAALARSLHDWQIRPAGTEGFNKAEVTLGGVDTKELSSKTMEAKKVPGLYFLGEVIDVTGHLGGYNLHWAWASGHAAGQYV
jgi:predicted Rossmann fold flavoprotein